MTTAEDADAGRLAAARAKVSDSAHAALDVAADVYAKTADAATSAFARTGDAATSAFAKTSDAAAGAFVKASDAATSAYSGAVDRASGLGRTAAGGIDASPLAALLGGIALGAVAGALLPRSAKEAELLGPLGTKFSDLAREALAAAKDAGFGALDEAGLNRENIRGQVDTLLDHALKAATAAGGAAAQSVRSAG